jgi:hypothetical protein
MLRANRHYKFSGRIAPDDKKFALLTSEAEEQIAPIYVTVPGGTQVPQYAPTVTDPDNTYAPATNCQGYFMSFKFQPNNNCYNYSCNAASNSFAQPGRMHGYFLPQNFTGADVVQGAELDGLQFAGDATTSIGALTARQGAAEGHYVALLISPADPSVSWPGDYHWVRCDIASPYNSWSQKDGGDQVTNFDFAGNPISNPATANWTVNQGPMIQGSADDVVVSYQFYAWLFVPYGQISII